MSFYVIIPARYSSSRLPGKPLIDLGGKPMIQRVFDLAKKSDAKEVIIATDHQDIIDRCTSFGANAVYTNTYQKAIPLHCRFFHPKREYYQHTMPLHNLLHQNTEKLFEKTDRHKTKDRWLFQ